MIHSFALDGKVIVVTGATGAVGKSFVEAIAGAGGTVGILGRNRKIAEDRATQINLTGGKAIALCADVTKKHDLGNARRIMLDTYGKIDGLVNAAGGPLPGHNKEGRDIFRLRIEEVKKVLDQNLWGTILPTLVFGESIARNGQGSIVNISSMAAERIVGEAMGFTMAKAAIESFTRWFAVELGLQYRDAIRINSIAPGFLLTERNGAQLTNPDGSFTEKAEGMIGLTPFKRLGNPEDLDGALVWLLSDRAKFVTGTTIAVDGGFMVNGMA